MTAPQPTLFDAEQREHLKRVHGEIARAILRFLQYRLDGGSPDFHADELRQWVQAECPTAPASADRILRNLRRTGVISYVVVSRAASLYRVLAA